MSHVNKVANHCWHGKATIKDDSLSNLSFQRLFCGLDGFNLLYSRYSDGGECDILFLELRPVSAGRDWTSELLVKIQDSARQKCACKFSFVISNTKHPVEHRQSFTEPLLGSTQVLVKTGFPGCGLVQGSRVRAEMQASGRGCATLIQTLFLSLFVLWWFRYFCISNPKIVCVHCFIGGSGIFAFQIPRLCVSTVSSGHSVH